MTADREVIRGTATFEDHQRVVLLARFTALRESETAVEDLIIEYADAVRAEPGNLVFDVYRSRVDPSQFVVFEAYRDRAAFDAHIAADAGRAFNQELEPHVRGGGSELSFLEPVSRA